MSLSKAIAIVGGCAFVGTIVGAGIGYGLGAFAPDFIRALFPWLIHFQEDTNFTQVGIGLGIVNGGLIGVGIGTLSLGILAWHDLRMKQLAATTQTNAPNTNT